MNLPGLCPGRISGFAAPGKSMKIAAGTVSRSGIQANPDFDAAFSAAC
jgi:hypothetical protein